MFDTLKVGDRVQLSGGYDMEPKWLQGNAHYSGTVQKFIPGQNESLAVVVRLDDPVTFEGMSGNIVILELRYEGAKWKTKETVHVELCDFEPEAVQWQFRKQGKWVESHATYAKI